MPGYNCVQIQFRIITNPYQFPQNLDLSRMIIGALTIELDIPAHSLKDKRQILRSVQARLRNKFNVSVAEVAEQGKMNTGVIGVVCVASDRDYAHGLLMKIVTMIEQSRLDCELVDFQIEMI